MNDRRQKPPQAQATRAGAWVVICVVVGLWLVFSARVSLAQELSAPVRIAEGRGAELLVTDYMEEAVFGVDKNTGDILWRMSINGKPRGVALVGDFILVSNETTRQVEAYDTKKQKLAFYFGSKGKKAKVSFFEKPEEIGFDAALNLVFVLDSGDKKVKVFSGDGDFLKEFLAGDAQQRALLPQSLAVDPFNKEILVSDYGSPTSGALVYPRILIYDYNGSYLRQVYADRLEFQRPQGLAVTSQGLILVVDCFLDEVMVFDRNQPLDADSLLLVKKLGGFGTGPGELRFPLDVVVDQAGNAFVTNNRLGRIEAFPSGGLP